MPRAQTSAGSRQAAGRAGSRPRWSSAASPPKRRLSRKFLEVGAGPSILWERRGANARDEPTARLAIELDGTPDRGRLALALDELVARRLGDEEDVSLLRLHGGRESSVAPCTAETRL